MSKPLSREEIIAEKAQLFKDVKAIRDRYYKVNPNLKICITDQQIRENIDAKYDYYKKCKNYYDFRSNNDKSNFQYLKQHIPGYTSPLRTEETAFIPKSQIKNMVKVLNTPVKRNYIHDKTVSKILSQNYQEVFACLFDADKCIDYTLKHQAQVQCGATFSMLISNDKFNIDPNVKKLLSTNKKIFESPFCIMVFRNESGSKLSSFLYKDKVPKFTTSEANEIFTATSQAFVPVKGDDTALDAHFVFSHLSLFNKDKEDELILDSLKKQNITNVLHYKPANKNESIVDSLINNHDLVKRPENEIKFIDEEFTKYEIPMLKERYENSMRDLKLSKAESEKYLKWRETHNPEDAFKRINQNIKNKELYSENLHEKDLSLANIKGINNIVNEEDNLFEINLNNNVIDELSPEEREKEALFQEAVKMRDEINGTSRGVLLSVSDEQIRKNIKSKYEVYKFASNFSKACEENAAFTENYLKEHGIHSNTALRGTDTIVVNKDNIEEYSKEINTPIKAAHYSVKQLEKLTKVDMQDVLHALETPGMMMKFVSENESIVKLGFTAHAVLQNSRISAGIENQIVPNELFYEQLFSEINGHIEAYSTPLTMLTEGVHPKGSISERSEIFAAINEKMATEGTYFREKIQKEPHFGGKIAHFVNPDTEFDTKKIRNALTYTDKNGNTFEISDISKYTAVDKNLSFQQALFENKGIRPKTPKELEDLQNEFNLYDVAYVKEKMKDPEHSNPLNHRDEELYNKVIKTNGKDPYQERFKKFDYNRNYFSLHNRMSKHELNERDNRILDYVNLKQQYDSKPWYVKLYAAIFSSSEVGQLRQRVNDQKTLLEREINMSDREVSLYKDVKEAVDNHKPNIKDSFPKHVLPKANLNKPDVKNEKEKEKTDVSEKKLVELEKENVNSSPEYINQQQLSEQNVLNNQQQMGENTQEIPGKK